MKQLEYPLVMPYLLKRRNGAVLELSIAVTEQATQGTFVYGRTNKRRNHSPNQLIKRQPRPAGNLFLSEYRQTGWDIETTVFGEPRQNHTAKICPHVTAACAYIIHDHSQSVLQKAMGLSHQPGRKICGIRR
ncbi:hypothetical protein D3C75_964400 [compost metagenome]